MFAKTAHFNLLFEPKCSFSVTYLDAIFCIQNLKKTTEDLSATYRYLKSLFKIVRTLTQKVILSPCLPVIRMRRRMV